LVAIAGKSTLWIASILFLRAYVQDICFPDKSLVVASGFTATVSISIAPHMSRH